MANNKMLIDASHPEETRVVVVRGNRIEEFDFEAQERRQLRGNIYLAKVTRVEPSLQAAFIDYGGNRHGFLAFSEIHPDYYQIPAADRQALLEAEAEAAKRIEEEEEAEVLEVSEAEDQDDDSEDDNEGQQKKRPRRKQRRNSRSRKTRDASAEDGETSSDNDDTSSDDETGDDISGDDGTSGDDDNSSVDPDSDDGASGSKTMAAMMDIDSISEPVSADDGGDEGEDDAAATETADEAPKKKTRRPAKRKAPVKKKAKADAEEAESADEVVAEEGEAQDAEAGEGDEPADSNAQADEDENAEPKKARRSSRTRRSSRKKGKASADSSDSDDKISADESGLEENGDTAEKVEMVGKDDALEEVQVRRPRRQYKIQEVIRRRQVMLVQVVKEERGNKGAALTTYLSLAGRYSVLMPNTARGGGISRKITNPGDRKRLKEIANSLDVPKGMGVILRTAGASLEKEEIHRDFDYLMRLWENVRNLTLASSAPFLVYEEGSLIKRSIRDLYNKDIGEIIVAGEEGYREAKSFMQMMMPDDVKNVKFYDGEQSLLSKFNIESQLEKMVAPQVTLKSGGYLVINQTEALVAIDVNSGRSTREHSIEATALQTNLEAAEEVARQLRLRDLAGLVVIDFIDMEEKRNNRAVERKLKDCLKNDRARIQVGHISHFGLMEMSRQRIRASVLESTMAVCPVCQGVGHVRSESSFAIHVLRAIDDHLNRHPRFDVIVKVAPVTAMYILNQKRQAVSELEDRYGVRIAFENDYHMLGQDFAVEKGSPTTREPAVQRAVNPMEFETDEPEESPDTENAGTAEEDEGSNGQKRNKRRRGRNRGRNRDRDGNYTDNSESDNANGDSGDTGDDDSNADPQPHVTTPVAATTDEAPAGPQEAPRSEKGPSRSSARKSAAKAEKPVQKVEVVGDEEVNESDEPRRRTGRPGKRVLAEPAKAEKAEAPKKPSTEVAGAPAKQAVRRNTKRVKPSKADNDSEVSSDEKSDTPSTGFNGGFLG